jgi:hypothetical protein
MTTFRFQESDFMLRVDERGGDLRGYVILPRELLTDAEFEELRTRHVVDAMGYPPKPKPPMPDLSKDGAFL